VSDERASLTGSHMKSFCKGENLLSIYTNELAKFLALNFLRYKCICPKTWPNPKSGTVKDNAALIIKELNYENDVRYGNTKLFIRSPQTVFALENKRTDRLPEIVVFLQKVLNGSI
jgi:myosin heavy subunit